MITLYIVAALGLWPVFSYAFLKTLKNMDIPLDELGAFPALITTIWGLVAAVIWPFTVIILVMAALIKTVFNMQHK